MGSSGYCDVCGKHNSFCVCKQLGYRNDHGVLTDAGVAERKSRADGMAAWLADTQHRSYRGSSAESKAADILMDANLPDDIASACKGICDILRRCKDMTRIRIYSERLQRLLEFHDKLVAYRNLNSTATT